MRDIKYFKKKERKKERKEEECIPQNLEVGKQYNFLKKVKEIIISSLMNPCLLLKLRVIKFLVDHWRQLES